MSAPRVASLMATLLFAQPSVLVSQESPIAFGDRIRVLAPSVSPEQLWASL